MTTHKPFIPPSAPGTPAPLSSAERIETDAVLAGVVAAEAVRAAEVAAVIGIGLLVCPPLAVLAFLFVAPFLVVALGLGLLVAVLSMPYFLFHHFRARDGRHLSLLAQRSREAARTLIDLAPHRIVADARKVEAWRRR